VRRGHRRAARLTLEQLAGVSGGAPAPPILPPRDGLPFLDRDKCAAPFAADAPEKVAAFMADSQVGFGVDALNGTVAEPAWRTKPSLVPGHHQ
jgi:hypothetical protein